MRNIFIVLGLFILFSFSQAQNSFSISTTLPPCSVTSSFTATTTGYDINNEFGFVFGGTYSEPTTPSQDFTIDVIYSVETCGDPLFAKKITASIDTALAIDLDLNGATISRDSDPTDVYDIITDIDESHIPETSLILSVSDFDANPTTSPLEGSATLTLTMLNNIP